MVRQALFRNPIDFSRPEYAARTRRNLGLVDDPGELWQAMVLTWTTAPVLHGSQPVSGTVLTYVRGAETYYRYVPEPYVPANDAFYSGWDGVTLTGLISTRA